MRSLLAWIHLLFPSTVHMTDWLINGLVNVETQGNKWLEQKIYECYTIALTYKTRMIIWALACITLFLLQVPLLSSWTFCELIHQKKWVCWRWEAEEKEQQYKKTLAFRKSCCINNLLRGVKFTWFLHFGEKMYFFLKINFFISMKMARLWILGNVFDCFVNAGNFFIEIRCATRILYSFILSSCIIISVNFSAFFSIWFSIWIAANFGLLRK